MFTCPFVNEVYLVLLSELKHLITDFSLVFSLLRNYVFPW